MSIVNLQVPTSKFCWQLGVDSFHGNPSRTSFILRDDAIRRRLGSADPRYSSVFQWIASNLIGSVRSPAMCLAICCA